jgi:Transport and Golgi organisation 2
MCTVALLVRPDHAWPVMLVANRDESVDRAWDPPALWWPEHPGVIAGRDRTAGGTWMGLNAHAVTAAVLNRPGSLGPAAGKRSRGELPLLALAEPTASAAVDAIATLDAGQWRGFNMVIADRTGATFIRGAGYGMPTAHRLQEGVSMITAHDPNDQESPRVARHLRRFRDAAPPEPDNWDEWRAILSDRSGPSGSQMNVVPQGGFGTVCSSLLAIPRTGEPLWLFAAGAPDRTQFEPVRSGVAASVASRP